MYGSMNENFIQDMVERTRMDKNSSFYDIGSGIGQVQIMKPNYFI
jgi:16S rRNA A1518/A1519 N6-dimethyltransferase RsmA/KsgA/DIM1 with predicted DNA glycosylase/AP lyase activity